MGIYEIIEDIFKRYKSGNNIITNNQSTYLKKKKTIL